MNRAAMVDWLGVAIVVAIVAMYFGPAGVQVSQALLVSVAVLGGVVALTEFRSGGRHAGVASRPTTTAHPPAMWTFMGLVLATFAWFAGDGTLVRAATGTSAVMCIARAVVARVAQRRRRA